MYELKITIIKTYREHVFQTFLPCQESGASSGWISCWNILAKDTWPHTPHSGSNFNRLNELRRGTLETQHRHLGVGTRSDSLADIHPWSANTQSNGLNHLNKWIIFYHGKCSTCYSVRPADTTEAFHLRMPCRISWSITSHYPITGYSYLVPYSAPGQLDRIPTLEWNNHCLTRINMSGKESLGEFWMVYFSENSNGNIAP